MNKYILGVAVVLIVVTGWFLTKNDKVLIKKVAEDAALPTVSEKDQEETPGDNMNDNNIQILVKYTNDGFSPAELTIKAGTTVTFINQSDAPMWIASGAHPTHLLYPEFDEKASVTKGGSYSFTFNKMGEHPYHNHLLLGKYGKIIVE